MTERSRVDLSAEGQRVFDESLTKEDRDALLWIANHPFFPKAGGAASRALALIDHQAVALEQARAALEFYADSKNYEVSDQWTPDHFDDSEVGGLDQGEIARKALNT